MGSKVKTIRAWGGFVDGKLFFVPPSEYRKKTGREPIYDEPRFAIFPTRKSARVAYQDVRRVEIVIRGGGRGASVLGRPE